MSLRTIIVNRDGLQYVQVATQETKNEKIAKLASRAGAFIDRHLFSSDISHLPLPKKEKH